MKGVVLCLALLLVSAAVAPRQTRLPGRRCRRRLSHPRQRRRWRPTGRPPPRSSVRTPTPTLRPASSPTPVPPQNPWLADGVSVGLRVPADAPARNYTTLVPRAVSYWNRNATDPTDYEVSFVLRPNATAPDVTVRFVDNITDCAGYDESVVGCAPLYAAVGAATESSEVLIDTT